MNYWLIKAREKYLIKIAQWAQKANVKVSELSLAQIKQILSEDKSHKY
jgi:hypothetical protein